MSAMLRVAQLIGAAMLALPLLSAFRDPAVTMPFGVVLVILAVSAAWRPGAALAGLILLLPVSALLQVRLGAGPPGLDVTDAWVFAFVAGASLRVRLEATPLATVAGALLAAVLASTVVDLVALQAIAPRRPLVQEIWSHVSRSYWTAPREFEALHLGTRWAGWLLLAIHAERIVAGWRADVVARLWMAAGALGGVMVVARIGEAIANSEEPLGRTLLMIAGELRLSVLHPDLNAAGSYFVLFLVPALALAPVYGRTWIWRLSVPLLLVGFVMARSRAAFGAAVAALTGSWMLRLSRRHIWIGGLAAGALLALGLLLTSRSNVALSDAAAVRFDLARVAVRTIGRAPVFGVGLADYIPVSSRQITPDMTALLAFAPRGENAHNNYLQFAAELGLPALVLLGLLVLPVAARGWGEPPGSPAAALALGITAFLLSALFGHPLLIPLVGTGFFLALGLASGTSEASTRIAPAWWRAGSWIVALVYVGSIFLRA